jgi:ABC-type transport system involved in cytochrome bd biosynthesis fused ATPase/permease subunit
MVLWRTIGWGRPIAGVGLYALQAALAYGPILILSQITQYLQGTSEVSVGLVWMMVALIFVLLVLSSLLYAHSNVIVANMGVQFRNVLTVAIYRKALRLSPSARQGSSTGQIVNMFSNDTKQLQMFMNFFSNTMVAPLQIIVSIVLIYFQMQVATFVGVGFMFLLLPTNGFLFGTYYSFYSLYLLN